MLGSVEVVLVAAAVAVVVEIDLAEPELVADPY